MTGRTLLILLFAICSTAATAQRQVVVADAETGVPVRDVQIFINGDENRRTTSDYKGETAIPDTARSLTLCHPKYEKRIMNISELADTVRLLPNYNRLNEIVIKGRRPTISPDMMAGIKPAGQVAPASSGAAIWFDFFGLFTHKKRKRTKQRIESIKDY